MTRDDKGRFIKGTSGNPKGRPSLSAELPYRDGLKAAISAENIAQVMERLFDLALCGNTKAADLYLAYALGKPVQTTELRAGLSWRQMVEDAMHDDPDTEPSTE